VAVTAVFSLISIGAGALPGVGSLISLFINGALLLGLSGFALALARGQDVHFSQLFGGFRRFRDSLVAYLLTLLYVLFWSLLLIVPGIMAMFSYALTFLLMADDETLSPSEAIARSKAMMWGNRWKLAGLMVRFFGWFIVGFVTMGIAFLWIIPYLVTSLSHF